MANGFVNTVSEKVKEDGKWKLPCLGLLKITLNISLILDSWYVQTVIRRRKSISVSWTSRYYFGLIINFWTNALRDREGCRRRNSFDLRRDSGESDVVGVVKLQRLTWTAHLAHMSEMKISSMLFRNNLDGRPKLWWIDIVKSDLWRAGN